MYDRLEGSDFDEFEIGESNEEEIGFGELNGMDDLLEGEAALYEDEDLGGLGVV